MTKKLKRQIETALRCAEQAQAYLDRPDVAVGLLDRPATTTLHYTRSDGSTFYTITKDFGSDLVGLHDCIKYLRFILDNETPRKEEEHVSGTD